LTPLWIDLADGENMKWIAPDYYKEFSCIAGECRHSCCIGWEIDIDAETLHKYRACGGEFGARLMRGICEEEDGAHFVLGEGERCPFLNEKGLCDIYLEMGEEALWQICTDHPRFRSFFSDRVEIGLGLCCEAAAELVLNRKGKMQLVELEKDSGRERLTRQEKQILSLREMLMDLAQDDTLPLNVRMESVLSAADGFSAEISFSEWVKIYLELERLDAAWGEVLNAALAVKEISISEELDGIFTNLLVYFLYRHVAESETVEDAAAYAAFAVHATEFVRTLCAAVGANDSAAVTEIVRAYSAEIEYSQENMDALMDCLQG